jgi:class III poly(R)-hydroxyalkanoic acid synthase PhaE subunit
MQPDPWAEWQAFSARFTSAAPKASGAAPGGPSSFAPFAELTERFNAAARAYFDGAANAAPAPAAATAAAARSFGDSLRELFSDIQLPWNLGGGANGSAPPMFAMNSPALGATREFQLRAQRIEQAWRHIEEAQRRLQRIAADAVREAAATFTARLAASPAPAPSAEVLQKLYGTWIDCAEDAYSRAAHSEPFCTALAEYVNASSEWRKQLQASVEHSAKLLDLPTRSEINTLTQRLIAVEHELRARHQEARPQAATATATATGKRKGAQRKKAKT